MKNTLEKSKCLASLAVFRELYDSEKDVYGIISEFLIEIILTESKHNFSLTEITSLLNRNYDFDIPEAVVKPSLSRIPNIKKSNRSYSVEKLAQIKSKNITKKTKEIQTSNENIINELFDFIRKGIETKLTDIQKGEVIHSFCSFLLDGSYGGKYSGYISGFILKNIKDPEFKSKLTTIKEGVILYSGIMYNNNLNEIGSWKSDLTIFIDTEILFNFAGYDGEIFKSIFEEFYNYVKEINRSHPDRIKLRYFWKVKSEIEKFFKKAEFIIEGKDKVAPSGSAMVSIVNGCKSKSDIVAKKTDFFNLLKNANIKEDECEDFFYEENYKYNIIQDTIVDDLKKSFGTDDISDNIRLLNYVSIHRKEANTNNFDNIGYILLTGNSRTSKIAWNKKIKNEGDVPLATTLDFLINKFWFKLNKGFNNNNYPASFKIITKAQIILSHQLNASVSKKFDELHDKYESGDLTEDQVKARILHLRKQTKNPENIYDIDVNDILSTLSEDDIEKFQKEQEHFKAKAERDAIENSELKKNIELKDKKIEEYQASKIELLSTNTNTKKLLLAEKNKSISIIETHKEPVEMIITKAITQHKIILIFLLFLLLAIVYYLLYQYGWEYFEKWTWVFGVTIPTILTLSYIIIFEKTLNPLQYIKNKNEKIKKQKYEQFKIDITHLDKLQKEKKILEKEISDLKNNN